MDRQESSEEMSVNVDGQDGAMRLEAVSFAATCKLCKEVGKDVHVWNNFFNFRRHVFDVHTRKSGGKPIKLRSVMELCSPLGYPLPPVAPTNFIGPKEYSCGSLKE